MSDISNAYYLSYQVTQGPLGQIVGKISPYNKLSLSALQKECMDRNLFHHISFKKKPLKQDYQDVLDDELAGATRVPALCFDAPNVSLDTTNLAVST